MTTYTYINEDGMEDIEESQATVEYIKVVQALSKAVMEGDATPGDLMNSHTGELIKGSDGVIFIPIRVTHEYKEWKSREQGGGLVATHEPTSDVVIDAKHNSTTYGRYQTEDGNTLEETYTLFGMTADGRILAIPMTSSKIPAYRRFAASIRAFRYNGHMVPLYAHTIRLTTEKAESKRGGFFNILLAPALGALEAGLVDPESELFANAQAAREMLKES